jgi:predicted metalloprotease
VVRLDDGDRSNVEDRRGLGGAGLKLGAGGTLVLLVLSLIFGRNLLPAGEDASLAPGTGAAPAGEVEARKEGEADLERIAIAAFNDAQATWERRLGDRFRPATLVLFWDGTRSGCGDASSAMGPFYCPLDEKVYLDLGFYRELARRLGARGDFAQAYVVAHEVAHHVQNALGIAGRVHEAQQRDPAAANELSVRLELQADCLAGTWAQGAAERGRLDPGDVEEALGAAAAVGDDRIQQRTTGRVRPESFTHGTAAQRVAWFRRGLEASRLEACDTFADAGP